MSKSNFSKFISGKGFYVALAICLVGAGSAAWVAVDKTLNSIEMAQPPQTPLSNTQEQARFPLLDEAEQQVSEPIKDVPKAQSEPSKPSASSSTSQPLQSAAAEQAKPSEQTVSLPKQPSLDFCLPINSAVTKEFSGNNLVHNATLNKLHTHSGVDFAAVMGTPVASVFTGQITKIYSDAMWGNVVEVVSQNDITAIYSGLQDEIKLTVGDVIKVGETIGTVGVIPSESAEEEHLHFAMKQNKNFIDPLSVIK